MNHLEIVERLCKMHKLLLQEKTGTPDEFAERLHVCRSQLYNIMDELKDCGAVIKYNRTRLTFYYVGDFDIEITKLHLSTK